MYQKYFDLREPGFSITPDPHYLFLTGQHREALAHLLYGTGEGGGFVLLTGEVGTGKTTVVRAFLEQTPEHVDLALVLNPALDERQLLQTICRELAIRPPDKDAPTGDLVEALSQYLLDAHARGRKPVLVIDEAQNLKPEVLEQVRLLTNLETDKHKLLQIFLIGQPELREMLERRELRQLAQRITARYHLGPLSRRETPAYIRHRLEVAGGSSGLFTPGAMRRIHRITGGVPRLINILCDRALLGACVTGRTRVGRRIVERAARELRGSSRRPEGRLPWVLAAGATLAGVMAVGTWIWLRIDDSAVEVSFADVAAQLSAPPLGSAPAPERPAPTAGLELPGAVTEAKAASGVAQQAGFGSAPAARPGDRELGLSRLAALWGVELKPEGASDPCDLLAEKGLICRKATGGLDQLRSYDRPALVRLQRSSGEEAYAVVTGLTADAALLDLGYGRSSLSLERLQADWDGELLILWRPPPSGVAIIGPGSASDAVIWLRQTLAGIPGIEMGDTKGPVFDAALTAAVKAFQSRHGLDADGIAGPETLIRLSTVTAGGAVPRLSRGT